MGEQRIGQGREKAKAFFVENPDKAIEIEKLIREKAVAHMVGAEEEKVED